VKASLVNTSTGQGGKGLDQVGGITVPVAVSGPMDNLKYRIDTRAMLEDKAKDELRRQLERRLGGKQEQGAKQDGTQPKKDDSAREFLRGLIR